MPNPGRPLSLDLSRCTVKSSRKAHYDYPSAITNISLKVVHPQHGMIGSLYALAIRRGRCRGEFFQIMDEHADTANFALSLFDKHGKLKRELVENDYRRGSGCWGVELDGGIIVYIQGVRVAQQFRRKGVASLLLEQLCQVERAHGDPVFIVRPSPELREDETQTSAKEGDGDIAYFRKAGFRRIGRTNFFAFTHDPDHPSRSLPATEDAPSLKEFVRSGSSGATSSTLHRLIALSSQCDAFQASIDVTRLIRTAYNKDATSISKADELGFTPLHIAAFYANVPILSILLTLPHDSGVTHALRSRENAEGLTPEELCKNNMRDTCEVIEMVTGIPSEHPESSLRALWLLKRAAGEDVGSEDEFIARHKWGCTCGACTGGWLSPRMRFRLAWESSSGPDSIGQFEDFESPEDLAAIYCVPLPLAPNFRFNKRFFNHFIVVLNDITRLLSTPGAVPLEQNIPPVAGTEVKWVLDYVTSRSMEFSSLLGDGSWDELLNDSDYTEYPTLPTCANDLEFGLVRRMMGLPQLDFAQRGHDEEDDGETDEDDWEVDEDDDFMDEDTD